MPIKKKEIKKALSKSTKPRDKKKAVMSEEKTTKKEENPVKIEKMPIKIEETSVIVKKAGKVGAYVYAVGRRKSAKAQVRLMEVGTGKVTINGKDLNKFFVYPVLQETVLSALKAVQAEHDHDVVSFVVGGGAVGQAGAIRLGIVRALIKWNETAKPIFKKMGFTTRDPRVKERKKFGLKKARRAPQWSKR